MLLDRDRPGDRERARSQLSDAIEAYHAMGMPRHEAVTSTLLAAA
jgi:hypothetical protein